MTCHVKFAAFCSFHSDNLNFLTTYANTIINIRLWGATKKQEWLVDSRKRKHCAVMPEKNIKQTFDIQTAAAYNHILLAFSIFLHPSTISKSASLIVK